MNRNIIRRRLLVDYRFQIGHIARLLLVVGLSGAAMFIILSLLVLTCIDNRLTIWRMPTAFITFCCLLGLVLLATVVWSMYYTRAIAGPILRMTRVLDAIAGGEEVDQLRVRFRRGDQFIQLEKSLQACISEVGRMNAERRRLRHGVDAAWNALKLDNNEAEAFRILGELRSPDRPRTPVEGDIVPDKTNN